MPLFTTTACGGHTSIVSDAHLLVSIGLALCQRLRALPGLESYTPKIEIQEAAESCVIILRCKCDNRSVMLCLVSKPSSGVELDKKN